MRRSSYGLRTGHIMIETIEFNNKKYPLFQSQGNAARFAIPYAQQVCKGDGYDIGCMKREWAFPGAHAIDLDFDDEWEATLLPYTGVDYIFSSHCLEHLDDWVDVMNYWTKILKDQGVLFLYLPHYDQEYWRPWNNRKHVNILSPEMIKDYMTDKGYTNIFVSERDLNHSFMAMGTKNG